MKKILLIAPSSYPVNGAEAIVNIKLLRALTKSGKFEIDLVSKKHKWTDYKTEDLSELGIKLRSLNIVEVDNKITLKTIWQHLLCFLKFGVVYKGSHWAVSALPIVKRLLKENKYDYVLTKDSPSLLLGCYAKRKKNLKWVAKWNDPYPINFYPQPYGKGWAFEGTWTDHKQIGMMRKYVDVHLFPSKRIFDYMMRYLKLDVNKTIVSPHVALSNELKPLLCDDSKLRIIHSGNLKKPRDPKTFLTALARFTRSHTAALIEVTILGVFDDEVNHYIKELGLSDHIKIMDPVSYDKSLEELANHHVALIIEANCEEGIFMPTKVSDFVQCGKPIFAISPKLGVLNDLYNSDSISYFASVDDEDAIYCELVKLYNDFLERKSFVQSSIPLSFTEEEIVNQYLSF